jgi:hypothetical protein
VFAAWKNGTYRTLEDMQAGMAQESGAYFSLEMVAELIRAQSGEWVASLRRRLQAISDPICEKYGLPVASLRLPEAGAVFVDAAQFAPAGRELMDLSHVKLISDMIVATIAATVCGGGGLAMILSGPVGLIAGAAAGVLISRGVTAAAERALWKTNIPLLMRKAFPTAAFENGLARRREEMLAEMQEKLLAQLDTPDARTRRMTGAVADEVTRQMEENLQRAVVLLR